MLLFVVRKMFNNKWMVLCLLIGSILTAAMVSSIPLYTNGILQRMLTRDLENSQARTGRFPGIYYFKAGFGGSFSNYEESKIKLDRLKNADSAVNSLFKNLNLPALAENRDVSLDVELVKDEDEAADTAKKRYILELRSITGLEEHVDIKSGRLYSAKPENGVYEVIVNEQSMKDFDLLLDKTYRLIDFFNENTNVDIRVKVVGTFTLKNLEDPFWNEGLYIYNKSLIIKDSVMMDDVLVKYPWLISRGEWYYALDYHKITLSNMKYLLDTYQQQKAWISGSGRFDTFKFDCISILEQYYERESMLKTTLWILQVPILIMLAFYIFMVSRLIVEYEKNEIAVLKSRGASGFQIFLSYLAESLILAAITLLAGPPLGMLLCRVMGASNGFLEFVQRASLKIYFSWDTYLYAFLAMFLFIITMLIPAIIASKTTIVTHKQQKARAVRKAVWHKFYFDAVLLLLSGYGYYRYSVQKKTLVLSGMKGIDLSIDPLLFLTSTFFILGAGLLFLRVFPYIVRLTFWAGKRLWSPVLYASFIQVGRSGGQEQFLMLFIIFSLSVGLFNSNAARTLNKGVEDRSAYEAGADIAIRTKWQEDSSAVLSAEDPSGELSMPASSGKDVHYIEPYFEPYTQLSGVETATKVLINNKAAVYMPTAKGKVSNVAGVEFMGIIPHEFGKVAWFRNDLLPFHINQYLNLMTKDRTAVLLSKSFKDKYSLKEGDTISFTWSGQSGLNGVIYAFIDYWPTFNPNGRKENDINQPKDFIVANLQYVHDEMAMEPYEIWIKKVPGTSSKSIIKEMELKKLPDITSIRDTASKVVERKQDPMLQGTNGSLTLGFIVTIIVCAVGFLIYWIISIKSRLLQFGIFRAMGLSSFNIIGMLLCEQILVSGTSIVAGILIGKSASSLFVKLFEIVYSAEQQMLPFKVVEYWQDYVRLYGVMGFVILLGFAVLGTIIMKIKVSQVIKLGED